MTKIAAVLIFASALPLAAQDPFEIQVYEYETVPKGMWNLETHINYVGRGTREWEGPVAPSDHQLHLTYELTRGITKHFEMAGYLVLAHRALSGPMEFAGWRLRPRVSLPREWGLPVDVSLSAEVGFPRVAYEENPTTLEIRPVFEKTFGKWQFDVNPVIARALRGPGKSEGWVFEPGVRAAWAQNKRIDWSLEYYGATGPLFTPYQLRDQAHIFFPGADIHFSDNVVWNLGIGMAATEAGNRIVYKMRLGWMFGRPAAE